MVPEGVEGARIPEKGRLVRGHGLDHVLYEVRIGNALQGHCHSVQRGESPFFGNGREAGIKQVGFILRQAEAGFFHQ